MSTATLPRLLSPCCQRPLEGGPVIYVCTGCRHDVHASVINREVDPPRPADCSAFHNAFGPGCPWCSPQNRAASRTRVTAAARCATTSTEGTS